VLLPFFFFLFGFESTQVARQVLEERTQIHSPSLSKFTPFCFLKGLVRTKTFFTLLLSAGLFREQI